jgi:hypothetical protein
LLSRGRFPPRQIFEGGGPNELNPAQQLAGRDSETGGYLGDSRDTQIAYPALRSSDLDRMGAAAMGQGFLSQPGLLASGLDVLADNDLRLHALDRPRESQ